MRRQLNWVAAEGGLERDGRWSCGTHDYPSMHHSLMHPCANKESNCCGDSRTAPFLLRFESFFHSKNALLVLAYEVHIPDRLQRAFICTASLSACLCRQNAGGNLSSDCWLVRALIGPQGIAIWRSMQGMQMSSSGA